MVTESSAPKVQIRAIDDDLRIDIPSEQKSMQPRVLRDLRYALHSPSDFQQFVATHGKDIVGHLSARIFGRTGWLAAAQINSEYQRMGIFNSLRMEAEQWLRDKGVEEIRVAIASDSLKIRNMFERKEYRPMAFAVEPNKYINPDEVDLSAIDHFSMVTDERLYTKFENTLRPLDQNLMVDSAYIPLDIDIWRSLVSENRVYTDLKQRTFIVLSPVYAPMTFLGFIVAETQEDYYKAGAALQAFAAKSDATEVIAHSPSNRTAILGLGNAGYSWSHPYSVIIYKK